MSRLLVVVDYQVDFINGALGFKGAEEIEDNILKLIKEFKNSGDDIVFTLDTHKENYMETSEGHRLPIPHCIKGTKGHELSPKVKEEVGNYPVFEKITFPSIELGNYIHERKDKYQEIYLCGLVSDICVFTNAIIAKAACNETTEIKVIRSATSSNDLETQEKSFDMLKHVHIDVI